MFYVIAFVKACMRNLIQVSFFIRDSSDRRTITHVSLLCCHLNVQPYTLGEINALVYLQWLQSLTTAVLVWVLFVFAIYTTFCNKGDLFSGVVSFIASWNATHPAGFDFPWPGGSSDGARTWVQNQHSSEHTHWSGSTRENRDNKSSSRWSSLLRWKGKYKKATSFQYLAFHFSLRNIFD